MLVSILIATRGRMDGLIKTINSFYETADPNNLEILLRVDDDDADTLNNLHLLNGYQFSHIVGPRLEGRRSHHVFMEELAEIATGKWCFFYDDDCTIIGKDWDKQLAEVPLEGFIVHPEFLWFKGFKLRSGTCVPSAICVPTRCWRQFGALGRPTDSRLQKLLIDQGWVNRWLNGIVANHEWPANKIPRWPIPVSMLQIEN